jgi:hypothetical protein
MGGSVMTDPDEAQLSKLAKRMLAMPPKKREESKVRKAKDGTDGKRDERRPVRDPNRTK